MAGAVRDVEDVNRRSGPVALIEPAIRREIAHAGHAEPRAAGDDVVEQMFIGDVRAFDRYLQRVAQFSGAADMVDMAVGQPDLFDVDLGLLDRGLNFRDVPAGVDHDSLFGGFAPDHRAVLLEQRHRNDDRAGLCLGLGLVGSCLHNCRFLSCPHNADFWHAAKGKMDRSRVAARPRRTMFGIFGLRCHTGRLLCGVA